MMNGILESITILFLKTLFILSNNPRGSPTYPHFPHSTRFMLIETKKIVLLHAFYAFMSMFAYNNKNYVFPNCENLCHPKVSNIENDMKKNSVFIFRTIHNAVRKK